MNSKIESKQKIMARLNRASGQLRAVCSMVEDEKDCAAIAQQLTAVRKALDKAFFELISCAMLHEVNESLSPEAARNFEKINQLLTKYG